jgi:hypothetical protein
MRRGCVRRLGEVVRGRRAVNVRNSTSYRMGGTHTLRVHICNPTDAMKVSPGGKAQRPATNLRSPA